MWISNKKLYTYFNNTYVMRRATNGWWSFDCPFCLDGVDEKKAAIHFEYGVAKCWKCGFKENVANFIMQSEDLTYPAMKAMLEDQEEANIELDLLDGIQLSRKGQASVTLPEGFTSLIGAEGTLGRRAFSYLENRGFDVEMLDSMGFGYCATHAEEKNKDYFGYIIIPFKSKGKLQYYIGRDFIGNYLRYKNPETEECGIGKSELLFNEDALNIYKRCWLSEGWSDAMTLGKTGVASLGWSLSVTQKSKILRSSCEELIMVPDKGFYKQAVTTASDMIDHKKIVVVNLDKVEEFKPDGKPKKDANELGYDYIYNLYKNTEPLTFERIIEVTV